jgi:NAD(P)-dependent dehydrogenase (short-subunit alcohol dehydrogenase family)
MSLATLAGKTALITGGSRGIGLSIAKAFTSHGATCILLARHPQPLDDAVTQLNDIALREHVAWPADVKTHKTWQHFEDVFVPPPERTLGANGREIDRLMYLLMLLVRLPQLSADGEA